jgi:serine kinase of HPr protein (carbohydrate metabolism regulator)
MTGTETIHAGCVSSGGRGVLIAGRSGSGKSDLALRLIDRGARLVSDDYTVLHRAGDRLVANAPETIAGRIEIRGVGIVDLPADGDVPVSLIADLDGAPERLPEAAATVTILGVSLPSLAIAGLEASAPLKLEQALRLFGLP